MDFRWALKEALVKASNRKDLRFPAIFVKKDKNGIFLKLQEFFF